MPTILRINGFRFFFYSNENNEPAHVHIEKGNAVAKVWLEPSVEASFFTGFNASERNFVIETIVKHSQEFKKEWYEYFGKSI